MATTTATTTATSPSEFVKQEFATTWQWRIDTDPELAASLGMLSRRRSRHALDPRSLRSFEQRLVWVEKALKRIETGITPEDIETCLTKEEQLSLELYKMQLGDYLKYTRAYHAYLCCVNRLEGPQTDLALYARYLPVKTYTDRCFYRDFLQAIPKQLMEVQELLSYGLEQKKTPPQVSLSGVVDQIRRMVEGNLESFSKPIQNAFLLPQEQDLKEECDQLLESSKVSFAQFADFLESEYIPNLRTEISASKGYPDGKRYYEDCLKFHTTTNMTPQEIHQLGLDEIKRVRSEMESIAAADGYGGKLEEYLQYLRTSPKFEPKSATELLAQYRDIIGRIYPALLNLFHMMTLPRQPLEITETPAASASLAPAAYYLAGSADSSAPRPGIFYVNTSELPTRRTYECEALALHEALPGHHTQGAIQGELPLPDFRRYLEDRRYFEAPCRFPFYTGYIEGWGLHSETLGKELGLYNHPTDQFGQLSMEAIRCCRLVVDTGMHALGWTQEQAVRFMLDNTAMGEHDARTEVARYITWPGQACAYKVGELVMRKMRTYAERELADSYDPRDFYDVVLLSGAVPLHVLQERVESYVERVSNDPQFRTRQPTAQVAESDDIVNILTFANWCKCCVVPGSCQL
ncbi:DUF885 domain containing protein [Nitzschia inconspicua]|uniref:DUF885 domain containing protein n=1 Tax=Nitzschia inconspicua TaxID=303405 RepID=A0A9K3KEV0_9STRA|nr:DUF885 domain containing protein [Nitzschia inconspicua]